MKLKMNNTYFKKLMLQQPRSLGAFLYDVSGPAEGKKQILYQKKKTKKISTVYPRN